MSAIPEEIFSRSGDTTFPEMVNFGELSRAEVRFRHSVLLGTSTSVSSAMLAVGLVAGALHTSGIQTPLSFGSAFGSNIVEEWRLLHRRQARTPLGEKLLRIRERIVGSGAPLLGWDELEKEVADRRGEVE